MRLAHRATAIRLLAAIVLLGVLEAACRVGLIDAFMMIPPSEIAVGLWRLAHQAAFIADVTSSMSDVVIAAVAAIVVGFAAGIAIHALPRVRRVLNPLFATYYAVPIIVFYPLFIVLFGLNNWPKIVIAFLYAVVAMTANTLNGLDRVPTVMFRTARIYRMGVFSTSLRIVLPSAVPHLFTGVKLAIAYAFIGIVGSEFILSNSGIGYEIAFSYNNFDNDTLYPLILFIVIVSFTLNRSLFSWERALLRRRLGTP